MNHNSDDICLISIKTITDIFSSKWSFVIMGELNSKPRRFNELKRSTEISTKSLSDALKSLEANGVVTRTVLTDSPITVEYSLTEKGRDFEGIIVSMNKWGEKWLKD